MWTSGRYMLEQCRDVFHILMGTHRLTSNKFRFFSLFLFLIIFLSLYLLRFSFPCLFHKTFVFLSMYLFIINLLQSSAPFSLPFKVMYEPTPNQNFLWPNSGKRNHEVSNQLSISLHFSSHFALFTVHLLHFSCYSLFHSLYFLSTFFYVLV